MRYKSLEDNFNFGYYQNCRGLTTKLNIIGYNFVVIMFLLYLLVKTWLNNTIF